MNIIVPIYGDLHCRTEVKLEVTEVTEMAPGPWSPLLPSTKDGPGPLK